MALGYLITDGIQGGGTVTVQNNLLSLYRTYGSGWLSTPINIPCSEVPQNTSDLSKYVAWIPLYTKYGSNNRFTYSLAHNGTNFVLSNSTSNGLFFSGFQPILLLQNVRKLATVTKGSNNDLSISSVSGYSNLRAERLLVVPHDIVMNGSSGVSCNLNVYTYDSSTGKITCGDLSGISSGTLDVYYMD